MQHVDGVMMGRAAYQEPWRLLAVDPLLFGEPAPFASAKEAALALIPYIERETRARARACMPSPAICSACSARCRARAPSAGIWRPRRSSPAPARRSWLMRWRWWWTAAPIWRTSPPELDLLAGGPSLLGYPLGEIVMARRCWIAGAGVLVGILAGLFGIGGGAIIVPVLYEVFRVLGVPEEVRMQLCIGTSLAIIVPTTVRSYLAHKQKGAVMPRRGAAVGAAGDRRRRDRLGDRRPSRRRRCSRSPSSCSRA